MTGAVIRLKQVCMQEQKSDMYSNLTDMYRTAYKYNKWLVYNVRLLQLHIAVEMFQGSLFALKRVHGTKHTCDEIITHGCLINNISHICQ
jgi:hypothetical protein